MAIEFQSARDALAAMGMTVAEVVEADEALRSRPQERDGRICLCGHGVSRHSEYAGIITCKPSKMDCPCKKVRAVLDAEDTRPFLRKTAGPGPDHALSRGLAALAMKEKDAHWIIDLECDTCHEPATDLTPVPLTLSGVVAYEPTGIDLLICRSCREKMA